MARTRRPPRQRLPSRSQSRSPISPPPASNSRARQGHANGGANMSDSHVPTAENLVVLEVPDSPLSAAPSSDEYRPSRDVKAKSKKKRTVRTKVASSHEESQPKRVRRAPSSVDEVGFPLDQGLQAEMNKGVSRTAQAEDSPVTQTQDKPGQAQAEDEDESMTMGKSGQAGYNIMPQPAHTAVLPTPPPNSAHNTPRTTNMPPPQYVPARKATIPTPTPQPKPTPRHVAPYTTHIVRPDPPVRQNTTTHYPHGVLSGGMLLDLLTQLTQLTCHPAPYDYHLFAWLQKHYLDPFGTVDRLDGIVVKTYIHNVLIRRAHTRFVALLGENAVGQRLWVPGLEPRYTDLPGRLQGRKKSTTEAAVALELDMPVDMEGEWKGKVWMGRWEAAEMYANGEGKKGVCEGHFEDERGCQRVIWRDGEADAAGSTTGAEAVKGEQRVRDSESSADVEMSDNVQLEQESNDGAAEMRNNVESEGTNIHVGSSNTVDLETDNDVDAETSNNVQDGNTPATHVGPNNTPHAGPSNTAEQQTEKKQPEPFRASDADDLAAQYTAFYESLRAQGYRI
ncbi:hypothetical protein IQ07DRAFT_595298 [Pyrenochaeta sp. DS3sAY3a]|nr:hypothetical protein IQ07DRAFT_595298 [Pyrenochaeta sp. DS3sAY3a]